MKDSRMKNMLAMALAVALGLTLVTGDAFARSGFSGSRSGGFSRSSSSSSSRSSSSRSSGGLGSSKATVSKTTPAPSTPSTPSKAVTAPVKSTVAAGAGATAVAAASTTKPTKSATIAQQNADAKSFKAMDTKSPQYTQTDTLLKQNIGTSGKTFTSRDAAKADMTTKMATKTYNYSDTTTAMANRPSYVPAVARVNGTTYNTTYVNGHYGYYNPAGMFIAYMAADMLITDMMLHSYGYRPTVIHPVYSPMSPIGMVIWLVIAGIVVIAIVAVVKNNA